MERIPFSRTTDIYPLQFPEDGLLMQKISFVNLELIEKKILADYMFNTLGGEFRNLSKPDLTALLGYHLYGFFNLNKTIVAKSNAEVLIDNKGNILGVFLVYEGPKWIRRHCLCSKEVNQIHLSKIIEIAKLTNGSVPGVLSLAQFSKDDLIRFAQQRKMVLHRDRQNPKIDHVIMMRVATNHADFEKKTKNFKLLSLPSGISTRKPQLLDYRHSEQISGLLNATSPFHSFHPDDMKDGGEVRFGYFNNDGQLVATIGYKKPVDTPYGSIAIVTGLATHQDWRQRGVADRIRMCNLQHLFKRHSNAIVIADVEAPYNGRSVDMEKLTSSIGYHTISKSIWFVLEQPKHVGEFAMNVA